MTRILAVFLLLTACAAKHAPLEALAPGVDVSRYRLTDVRGTRDGDRLAVQATFTGGASPVVLEMRFAVGTPTTLESGRWRWEQQNGSIDSRSVTFLGGQSGPPSIGGTFDLLPGGQSTPILRARIPNTELATPWLPR